MIKVLVIGAMGRMGSQIIKSMSTHNDIKLIAAIETPTSPHLGQDIGELLGIGSLKCALSSNLSKVAQLADVSVDFTNAKACMKNLKILSDIKSKIVIGTTGFTPEDRKTIHNYSQKLPILISSNMSVGINLLLKILPDIVKALSNTYDIEIIESHHRFKKDAPSGTAISLAKAIKKSLNSENVKVVFGRNKESRERTGSEIVIHSIRAGDIVGEHTVILSNIGERLELTHKAHNRDAFASGVIRAIKFIANKSNGLYSMQDVLF